MRKNSSRDYGKNNKSDGNLSGYYRRKENNRLNKDYLAHKLNNERILKIHQSYDSREININSVGNGL